MLSANPGNPALTDLQLLKSREPEGHAVTATGGENIKQMMKLGDLSNSQAAFGS